MHAVTKQFRKPCESPSTVVMSSSIPRFELHYIDAAVFIAVFRNLVILSTRLDKISIARLYVNIVYLFHMDLAQATERGREK